MLGELFFSFMKVGLFSVGGGYAAIPLIAQEVVSRRMLLTRAGFADLVTIAEMTPGPIAVNAATFVGMNVAGPAGALAATLGCIAPSILMVSLLAAAYRRWGKLEGLRCVMDSLRPAVVALIACAALEMLCAALKEPAGRRLISSALTAIAFWALRTRAVSPIAAMTACGCAAAALHAVAGGSL